MGPDGGRFGGEIVYTGTPADMVAHSDTITAKCLKYSVENVKLTNEQLEELTRSQEIDNDVEIIKQETEEEEVMKPAEPSTVEKFNY